MDFEPARSQDPDQVIRRALEVALPGSSLVEDFRPLHLGQRRCPRVFTAVVEVANSHTRVVLKITDQDRRDFGESSTLENECRALRLCYAACLPVPRLIAHDEAYEWLLMSFIGGVSPRNLPPVAPDLAQRLGRLLALVHELDVSDASGFVRCSAEDMLTTVSGNLASLGEGVLPACECVLTELQDAGIPSASLVLNHGDISLANLNVDADGELWLLDWEQAALAPAGADIASALHSDLFRTAEDGNRLVRLYERQRNQAVEGLGWFLALDAANRTINAYSMGSPVGRLLAMLQSARAQNLRRARR